MKKIIFSLLCFICSSCSITTTMIGDVTTFTQNGEILQKWEQVVLQDVVSSSFTGNYVNNNAFKTFGINFYDKKSGKYIIIGNAVPCIIEYTIESSYNSPNINYQLESRKQVNGDQISSEQDKGVQISGEQDKSDQHKSELINQWKSLSNQEIYLKSLMNNTVKNSIDYQNLKNRHKGIVTQMEYISNKLWNLFGYDIKARDNK